MLNSAIHCRLRGSTVLPPRHDILSLAIGERRQMKTPDRCCGHTAGSSDEQTATADGEFAKLAA